MAETKRSITNFTDGSQFTHMGLVILDNTPFYTTQGLTNPTGASNGVSTGSNRIGDYIQPVSLRYKMYLQNNERFGQVFYKFWFISCSPGYAINANTFFAGRSDNKILDDIEAGTTGDIKILWKDQYWISNPTPGFNANQGSQIVYSAVGSGTYGTASGETGTAYMPGARYLDIYIPCPKKIEYQKNGSSTPANRDYYFLMMPYVLQNTSTTLNVATLNEMLKVLKFKDI